MTVTTLSRPISLPSAVPAPAADRTGSTRAPTAVGRPLARSRPASRLGRSSGRAGRRGSIRPSAIVAITPLARRTPRGREASVVWATSPLSQASAASPSPAVRLTRRGMLLGRAVATTLVVVTVVTAALLTVAVIAFARGSGPVASTGPAGRAPAHAAVAPAAPTHGVGAVVGGSALAVATDADGARVVTVLPGQTLWQIARALAPTADPRVTIAHIAAANDLGSAGDVRAGQRLLIPAAV